MKNFIKFVFLFFIFILTLTNRVEPYALPAYTDANCVIEAVTTEDEIISTTDGQSDKKYSLLQKFVGNCEISSVNTKNNTLGSSDNRFATFKNNKLTLNYKHYSLKYTLRSSHKISPILENAIIARAP